MKVKLPFYEFCFLYIYTEPKKIRGFHIRLWNWGFALNIGSGAFGKSPYNYTFNGKKVHFTFYQLTQEDLNEMEDEMNLFNELYQLYGEI